MPNALLIVKETRAGEKRVALIPEDVAILVKNGIRVYVEDGAGCGAGYDNAAYEYAGAHIRYLQADTLDDYRELFKNIDIVVRVKRAERKRELLENKTMARDTLLIGALDPFEKDSLHMEEYQQAEIKPVSLDQLDLDAHDPMNILAAMSRIAGELALLDALEKHTGKIHKVVIIGYGQVGQAAFNEAIKQNLKTWVMVTRSEVQSKIEAQGGYAIFLDGSLPLSVMQEQVLEVVRDADIVITSARRSNQLAPLLIPKKTLNLMKSGSVVVDMSLSEGGNVEGCEHDATKVLGNGVIVTNTSGYPKAKPHEASKLWSKATLLYLLKFLN